MDIQHLRADYLISKYIYLPNFPQVSSNLLRYVSFFLFVTLVLTFIIYFLRRILAIKFALTEPSMLLELTPPAFSEKTAYTTQQLFATLHDLSRQTAFSNRLIGRKRIFSFEIVSTKTQGIRYIIRTEKKYKNSLRHHLLSYLPQVRVNEVEDYLPQSKGKTENIKIIELEQIKHFAYPLRIQNNLEEHDPVAYITGIMTKLQSNELIAMQVVLTPSMVPDKEKIKRMIYRGEDTLAFLDKFRLPTVLQVVLFPINILIKVTIALLSVFAGATRIVVNDFIDPRLSARQAQMQYQSQYAMQAVKTNLRPARVITPFEQQAVESIENKIEQKMFQAQVRLLMIMNDAESIAEREHGFLSTLSMFTSVNDQSLKKKFLINISFIHKYFYFLYRNRLLSLLTNSSKTLLSVSEVADLYHFPFAQVNQTENIIKVHSRELPAPVSLKNNRRLDVVFGVNTYGGTTTPIGLTEKERETPTYMLGKTGSGKTTLMFSMAKHDIEQGRGLAFIDPHGDVAEDLLASVPLHRKDDLIYINPIDLGYPIGINILELTPGLSEDAAELEKEVVTEGVISLFRRVFSNDATVNAHRIEYILRNTIYTAFLVENRTIFTLSKILSNPTFRKQVISKLKDEDLIDFWKYEFGKAGDFQVVKMTQGVTAKVGRFLRSPTAKRILEQEKSTINFDDIMNSRKILICNLSLGKLGEDTSRLLGTTILTKLQQAALKRAYIPKEKRVPFYLYVDEFQTFATQSFAKIITESRKYAMPLIIAQQSTSQQDDKNVTSTLLANITTNISFRTGNYMDEELMLKQFSPYLQKGEVMNLPQYMFYIKISATDSEEPFSGKTIYTPITKDMNKINILIESSRRNWAITYQRDNVTTDKDAVDPVISEPKNSTKKTVRVKDFIKLKKN
jgi:hypothetical protein